MRIAYFTQFSLLLKKNFVIQKRKRKILFYEISIATAVFVFFIILKFFITRKKENLGVHLEPSFEATTNTEHLYKTRQAEYSLAYSPISQQSDQIIKMTSTLLGFRYVKEFGFEDESEVEKKIYDLENVYGAVIFSRRSFVKNPDKIAYKIRIKHAKSEELYYLSRMQTKSTSKSNNVSSYGYLKNGFISIQQALDTSIIKYLSGDYRKIKSFLKKLPYIPQSSGDYLTFLKTHFPFFVMLGTIVVVSSMCYEIAYERETNVKEFAKLIGLNSGVYWLAWLVKYAMTMVIFVTALTFFLHFSIAGNSIINHTSFSLTFTFLLLYKLDVVAFNFFLSSLFNRAQNAINAGVLFSVLSYIPHFYLYESYDSMSTRNRMLLCLVSIYSLCQGFRIIAMEEEIEKSLKWSEITITSNTSDTLAMSHIFLVQIISCLLYIFLAWLIDTFASKQFLLSKVLPKYDPESRHEDNYIPFLRIEKPPFVSNIVVKIQGLLKKFRNHKNPAVLNLSLDVSEKETIAILGPMHSGKTTVFAILIGLISPTRGSVDIMIKETAFCFSFDVFFEDLTVEENLELFARLKGCEKQEVSEEVKKTLLDTDLTENKNDFPRNLSRLSRRKLSIGIAFIAGSKIIFMDEPTHDFDLESRLEVWHLLKSLKRGQIIIFTTHYMDEAEYLANRIAVMELGKLQCYGSSKFLRETHDTGYYLNIVVPQTSEVEKLDQLVSNFIPEAIIVHNSGLELSYFLPKKSYSKFVELFDMLETVIEKDEIKAFGVSFNTADENFFKLNKTKTLEVREKLKTEASFIDDKTIERQKERVFENVGKIGWWTNQLKLIFMAKMFCISRKKIFLACHLIISLLITFQNKMSGSFFDSDMKTPVFPLNVIIYPHAITPYSYTFGHSSVPMKECLEKYLNRFKIAKKYIQLKNNTESFIDTLVATAMDNIHSYRKNYYLGVMVGEDYFVGLYNDESHHSIAMSLSMINNAWLNCLSGNLHKNIYIEASNHPLPNVWSNRNFIEDGVFSFTKPQNLMRNSIVLFFAMFAICTIQDKISGLKSVQNIGRLNLFFYWVSTFVFDYIFYVIFIILLVVILFVRNLEGYSDLVMARYAVLLCLIYGFAALPFVYVFSLLFQNPKNGFIANICLVFFVYTITNLHDISFRGLKISFDENIVGTISSILKPIFPFLLLSEGLKNIFNNHANYRRFLECIAKQHKFCIDNQTKYLAWNKPGISKILLILFLVGVLYFSLLLLFESMILKKIENFIYVKHIKKVFQLKHKTIVNTERKHSDNEIKVLALELKDIYKVYSKNKKALKNINLKVEEGKVLCLLGNNGTGKSTMFKVITKLEPLTKGTIFLDGVNTESKIALTKKSIGYGPQHSVLIDQMTIKETISLHASLKGLRKDKRKDLIDNMLKMCNLYTSRNHRVHMLSRANKGKLAITIAAIGFPRILLLDQPTEEMDILSMREIWKYIYEIKKTVPTILVATNNVQECDALATQIGIMINGQFKFLGNNAAAREKASVRVSLLFENFDKENAIQVHSFVKRFYPDAVLQRMNNDTFKYYIKKDSSSGSLGQIFKNIENNKIELNIKRYALYYSSLEYFFFSISKNIYKRKKGGV